MMLPLEDDHMCYACGDQNLSGLKLRFDQPQDGILRSEVTFSKIHQGFKGVVHGGMLALVLDDIMVNLSWRQNIPAVTGELTLRLKKPTPINEKIYLEAKLEREEKRVVYFSAQAKNTDGQVLATATAACPKVKQQILEAPKK